MVWTAGSAGEINREREREAFTAQQGSANGLFTIQRKATPTMLCADVNHRAMAFR